MGQKLRIKNKLTSLALKKITQPGRYSDGNNLYLKVEETGSRRWILRLSINGKRRDMGLGSFSFINLNDARELAEKYNKLAKSGIDPVQERLKEKGLSITFKECVYKVYALNKPTWKTELLGRQWINSFEHHVFPTIGHLSISQVSSADIMNVLTPLWNSKHDTAKKLKQRLRVIFKWSRAHGYFTGDNPVELAEMALPRVKSTKRHFTSLPYDQLPDFIYKLRNTSISLINKLAIEFTILTACRTSEVLRAKWDEINLNNKVWTIPKDRMKTNREHLVPLSDRSILILKEVAKYKSDINYIFPSEVNVNKPLSNNTMLFAIQKRMGLNVTVHGMRSSFKNWASETTHFPNEVSEMALAHSIHNKVEAAYRRGNLLEKRRLLMQCWSDYLNKANAEVIKLYQNMDR
ncbi:tyrosine-type recombinase/integrase [Alphaproteobacteria bacterium]|nr:tyrosine-type recombinase/integrase [Alphaproteobacteria bacterium]